MIETGRKYISISKNLMVLRFEVTLYDPENLEPKEVKRLQVSDTQLNECSEDDFIALVSYFNQNPGFIYEIHEMSSPSRKTFFADWVKKYKISWYEKYRLLIPE
jgi:hypothetical protein